jgi:AcrR family transcriptional regulator
MGTQEKATGKEAVMQAVIEAACELLMEKSPSQLSIREIAKKAGVNHGLVHRHFGSKQNLISQVVEHIDRQMREAAKGSDDFQQALRLATELAVNDARFWRIPARLIMDGQAELLQANHASFLREWKELAVKNHRQSDILGLSPEEAFYTLVAFGLGHEMFGEYISQSMGIELPDTEELLQKLLKLPEVR